MTGGHSEGKEENGDHTETGQNRNYERNLMTCAIVVFKATGSEKMIMEKRWSVHQQHPLAE